MVIPINYRKSAEGSIASYDYFDIAEGTGIIVLYGAQDAAGNYVLSNQTLFSATIETSTTTSLEMNFDLAPFNLPKDIKGTAIVSYGTSIQGNTGGGTLLFTFYKVSDSVETSMGSCTVSHNKPFVLGEFLSATLTETHFKIGDSLRLSVLLTDNSDVGIGFGLDPLNRDGTASYGGFNLNLTPSTTPSVTTQLKFYCPFKIDI